MQRFAISIPIATSNTNMDNSDNMIDGVRYL